MVNLAPGQDQNIKMIRINGGDIMFIQEGSEANKTSNQESNNQANAA